MIMKLQEILINNKHWNSPIEGGPGTDKNTGHSYISGFYEEAFFPYKTKHISILEIGIARGDSLLLWNEYFKNSKLIYGLDNHNQLSSEVKKGINIGAKDIKTYKILKCLFSFIKGLPYDFEAKKERKMFCL